ncbi:MAG TPA: gamma-glutamyl-gamma-aminobutyrate hydrolase family protein, partial [Candidatus Kapabacteria bacterium]
FEFYRKALRNAAQALDYDLEVIDLSKTSFPFKEGDGVDGILFTGGDDVAPERYGKQSEAQFCGDLDETRDALEFRLADEAEAQSIPVFGICRGMQLLNVHRGGTLITDIEHFGGASHRKIDGYDRRHEARIEPGSYLRRVLGESESEVNSAHHQAVEQVGEGLTVSARAANDGTAEALEWKDSTGKPFFLAVQWHPERMEFSEQFAGRLFETFLWEAAANKMLKTRTALSKVKSETASPHS